MDYMALASQVYQWIQRAKQAKQQLFSQLFGNKYGDPNVPGMTEFNELTDRGVTAYEAPPTTTAAQVAPTEMTKLKTLGTRGTKERKSQIFNRDKARQNRDRPGY